jgi:hypothetical protein
VMIVHLPFIVSISRDDCALAFHCQYITWWLCTVAFLCQYITWWLCTVAFHCQYITWWLCTVAFFCLRKATVHNHQVIYWQWTATVNNHHVIYWQWKATVHNHHVIFWQWKATVHKHHVISDWWLHQQELIKILYKLPWTQIISARFKAFPLVHYWIYWSACYIFMPNLKHSKHLKKIFWELSQWITIEVNFTVVYWPTDNFDILRLYNVEIGIICTTLLLDNDRLYFFFNKSIDTLNVSLSCRFNFNDQ